MAGPGDVRTRVDAALNAIAAHDPQVRAFCDLRADAARAEAEALDRVPSHLRQPLHGVVVAVKEVYDVAGCLCAWGTPIHAGRRPAADCDVVARLKSAGAVVLGTVTSTEYAMARETPTGNPYALDHTPGASSSGAAAAVAARFVDLAIGSQTIGSGIRPAAYCGVFGLKPTHGAISLSGAMPLSERLDHAVVFARDLDLVDTAWQVLRAGDPAPAGDLPSASLPPIGLVAPWFDEAVDPRVWTLVQAAVSRVAAGSPAAPEAVEVPAAVRREEQACLETILAADMWRHHAADERAAGEQMSADLRAWLARGSRVPAEAYDRERARAREIEAAMLAALGRFELLATVATTGVAPLRTQGSGPRAPQRLWSLLGWPALAVPLGLVDGLPASLQLIARPGQEAGLIAAGRRFAAQFTVPPPRLPQPR